MEEDVSGFEVVMDDLSLLMVQILQSAKHLHDDALRFALGESLALFEHLIEIPTVAELKDSDKAGRGDTKDLSTGTRF
eukprot:637852-Amorphochlora_amoeboformis.AAC.1